ncbi:MAG: hypothetical protein IPK83_20605 [Planctomycetes bacterium]|nr:hypothetical protein [Planctomycetota bacterium]
MITPRERAASQPANDVSDRSTSYRITRHALADGKQLPVGRGGPLMTEPMESFGGLFVRDKSIIVLDGPRIIGYVAE